MTNENTSKVYRLHWLCPQTGKRLPAGVAFFNESKGNYRLKVDVFPEDRAVYLHPTSMSEGIINFRVEASRKGGSYKSDIGVGHAVADEGFPICMDIGPYSRKLILEAAA